MSDSGRAERFHLDRVSAAYWRVTFGNPPLNIFGPDNMPELNAVVAALESDRDVTIAETKRLADIASLPPDSEIAPESVSFLILSAGLRRRGGSRR
jgi:hypothetical protein